VRDVAGDYRGAIEAYKPATRLLGDDPVARAEVFEDRALAWMRLSSFSLALRDTKVGLECVASSTNSGATRIGNNLLALRAIILLQQGRPREAIAVATEVVGRAESLGPSRALARAYSALDGGYLDLGEPENAIHEVKALEIYRELGAARPAALVESNLGVQAYAEGRWHEASAHYLHAQEELERVGDSTQAALAGANLGEVLISRGLLDEAGSALEKAKQSFRAAEHLTGALFAETQLARLALLRGEVTTAIEDLVRIVDEAMSVGNPAVALESSIYLAEGYAQNEEAERALDTLDEAERTLGLESSQLAAHLARARAVALAQTGDSVGALEQAELAVTVARRQRLLYEEQLALRVLAQFLTASGEELRARQALDEAESLAERLAASS